MQYAEEQCGKEPPSWIDGPPAPQKVSGSPGAQFDCVLAEHCVSDELALVVTAAHLDYNEAATLSCAGITAWNTPAFREGRDSRRAIIDENGGRPPSFRQAPIAAGMPITGHPSHRSRRAQLGHRAPTSSI